jgi:hypothetical protein
MEMPLVRVNRTFHYVEELTGLLSGREFNITNVSTAPVWAILEQHPSLETWKIIPFPLYPGVTAQHFLNAKLRYRNTSTSRSLAAQQVVLEFKLFVYKAGPEVISDPSQCIDINFDLTVPCRTTMPYEVVFHLSPQ